jgi:hypothetical protein
MLKIKNNLLECCSSVVGGLSARAAREKMYEHASAILAKSSSSSQLFHEKDLGTDSTAHKNGKMELDMKPKGKKKYSGMKMCYIVIFE